MTRPVFESPEVPDIIERVRRPESIFTIVAAPNNNYLELRCVNSDYGQDFRFYMNYTEDLASGIGDEVEYRGGMILFTDDVTYISDYDDGSETEDFNLIMPILESDYVIPIVEDIEECPVCLETYEPMYGPLCGHNVCNDCMRNMDLKGLTKCPLCRSDSFKFPIALACNRSFVNA